MTAAWRSQTLRSSPEGRVHSSDGPKWGRQVDALEVIDRGRRPEEGQIFVQGRSLAKLRPSEIPLLRRKVGVVLQDFRLLPGQSYLTMCRCPSWFRAPRTVKSEKGD